MGRTALTVNNQRRQQRFSCSLFVRYQNGSAVCHGIVTDISEHGAQLLCEPNRGLPSQLLITPETQHHDPASGRVVWSRTDAMTERLTAGIEFEKATGWAERLPAFPTKERP